MENSITRSNGELIKKKIIFAPPPHDAIVKITNIKDNVIIESNEVVESGEFVLVKGYLNKSIEYNTANKGLLNRLIGNEETKDEENDESKKGEDETKKEEKKPKKEVTCESVTPDPQCMAVDGVVRHTTVWIPFEILVHVPDAKKGDKVNLEILDPRPIYKDNEIIENGLIVGVLVNDVITINVTVTKDI